jgi:hypothetical protein
MAEILYLYSALSSHSYRNLGSPNALNKIKYYTASLISLVALWYKDISTLLAFIYKLFCLKLNIFQGRIQIVAVA